ncbi:MAG: 1,4-alpha-glucan branching protein domain-containing protein [Bacillota bacterium]
MRGEGCAGAGNAGPSGSCVFVFHSHIPYCRKAGMWPFGEEWLYEAMLESYIPLLELLRAVANRVPGGGSQSRSQSPSRYQAQAQSQVGRGTTATHKPPVSVTIGITPILLDQLDDEYMREGFLTWAEARLARAEDDRGRFRLAGDSVRERQAAAYCERYGRAINAFRSEYGRDIAGAFGALQERGVVEIITSAATHAYLPLLKEDTSIRAQLAAGCESYVRRFGRVPRGIWLPECAYRPGLEEYLQALGLEYFFVDRHAVEGGEPIGIASGGGRPEEERRGDMGAAEAAARHAAHPAPWPAASGREAGSSGADGGSGPRGASPDAPARTTFRPYLVGGSKVACFGRNERVTTQVWSSWLGYPGDGLYREFHRKDDVSGLQYWRVTSRDTDLGAKELYDAAAASSRLREHAAHFVGLVHELVADWWASAGEHGVVVAPYDTELFGHWWYEGVDWLGAVLEGFSGGTAVAVKSAGQVLDEHPPEDAMDVPESSWGRGGRHDVWLNDNTAWMWEMIHAAEARVKRLAALCPPGRNDGGGTEGQEEMGEVEGIPAAASATGLAGLARPSGPSRLAGPGGTAGAADSPGGAPPPCAGLLEGMEAQALREFFLLMSSDWPFLVTERQATEYGAKRFREHAERFDRLMDYAERLLGAAPDEKSCEEGRRYLVAVSELDDPFPWLDFSILSGKGPLCKR